VSALRNALQQPPSLVKLAVWLQAGGPVLARTPGAAKVIGDLLVRCGEEAPMALRGPVDAAALSETVFDLARRMHAWLHDNTGSSGSAGGAGAADRVGEASAAAGDLQLLHPACEDAEGLNEAAADAGAVGAESGGLSAAGGAAQASMDLAELADAANSAAAAAEALAGAASAVAPLDSAAVAAAAAGAALSAADAAGGM
jgi:hypothetical protein